MRQVGQEKIKTVSIVFPNNKLDESKYSRLAAKTYNTEHIEIPFYEKDLLDDFDIIMSVMDQPTIDGINTYFVSKAAKQAGLKVVLSGLGGDELFGGYPSFTQIPKYQRIKNLPFAKMFMKAAAPLLKNRLPAKAIEYFLHPDSENAEYKLVRGLFTEGELQSMGWDVGSQKSTLPTGRQEVKSQKVDENVISKRAGESEKSFQYPVRLTALWRDKYPESNIQDLTSLQYVSMMETTYYMRNQLLRDKDAFSMVHSLELRVPFVDHMLYAEVFPYLDKGFNKSFSKKMLVDAVGDIPIELINRPKMGFTFPFDVWMREGKLKDVIKDTLLLKDMNNVIPFEGRKKVLEQFETGKIHWSRVWALFILSRINN
jgi:asparagine synthase (glutamine-hydrolysing)